MTDKTLISLKASAVAAAVLMLSTGAHAAAVNLLPADYDAVENAPRAGGAPGLQCVPYARQTSGIQLRGDAWTWWDQAAGLYARGNRPMVGAVMAFRPYGRMQLGHVATVSRVIDSRTVLVRHANWSPIDGQSGQVENDVMAVDASPANDWSEVRVWFEPAKGLGTTHWPVAGFIYNRPLAAGTMSASAAAPALARTTPAAYAPVRSAPARYATDPVTGELPPVDGYAAPVSRAGFTTVAARTYVAPAPRPYAPAPRAYAPAAVRAAPAAPSHRYPAARERELAGPGADPIGAIIATYSHRS